MNKYNRKRSKTIAFRVTPEECELIDKYSKLSGLSKQDYLTSNMLNQTIVVQGNPRVFKVLKEEINNILIELRRIDNPNLIDKEFRDLIKYIADMVERVSSEH